MRKLICGVAVALLTVLMPALALADDMAVAQQIISRLQRQREAGNLQKFDLGVRVENGDAWISGEVADDSQKRLVLDVAARVPGVTQVIDDVAVRGMQMDAVTGTPSHPSLRQPSGVAPASAIAPTRALPPAGNGYAGQAPPMIHSHAGMPMAPPRNDMPVAFARAHGMQGGPMPEAIGGHPVPGYVPGTSQGVAPAQYDHPHMPGHAWPSYAAYPNYAGVSYPKQYSPTAWPYIGPFYPYPQVPLGWRKVTMQWKDGWWWLDFKAK